MGEDCGEKLGWGEKEAVTTERTHVLSVNTKRRRPNNARNEHSASHFMRKHLRCRHIRNCGICGNYLEIVKL